MRPQCFSAAAVTRRPDADSGRLPTRPPLAIIIISIIIIILIICIIVLCYIILL